MAISTNDPDTNRIYSEISALPIEQVIESLLDGAYDCRLEYFFAIQLIVESGYRFQLADRLLRLKRIVPHSWGETLSHQLALAGYIFTVPELLTLGNAEDKRGLSVVSYMALHGHVFTQSELDALGNPVLPKEVGIVGINNSMARINLNFTQQKKVMEDVAKLNRISAGYQAYKLILKTACNLGFFYAADFSACEEFDKWLRDTLQESPQNIALTLNEIKPRELITNPFDTVFHGLVFWNWPIRLQKFENQRWKTNTDKVKLTKEQEIKLMRELFNYASQLHWMDALAYLFDLLAAFLATCPFENFSNEFERHADDIKKLRRARTQDEEFYWLINYLGYIEAGYYNNLLPLDWYYRDYCKHISPCNKRRLDFYSSK
jgi:hypothetical protein